MWLVGIVICAGWIFSLCLHEFSHAIVAYLGGDTSVKRKGYLTFNPLKYADPGYSIALPLLFLLMGGLGLPGGAVYIDRESLKNRWWQSAVSIAGPIANICLAVLLSITFQLAIGSGLEPFDRIDGDSFLAISIAFLIHLQVFAAIFNLLPIPGLDGYGIVEPWLSDRLQAKFDRLSKYSTLIIIGLFWYVPWFSNWTFDLIKFIISNVLNIPDLFIDLGTDMFANPINRLITFAILMTLGWSLNPQAKNPFQKIKSLFKKKVARPDRVHPETYQRAIELIGKDLQRIQRLLDGVWFNHPSLSEQWYWEKIIHDIERDRRR
jgi:Zn-dependent protease